MTQVEDRKFFVITPYSSMDPIGSPLSYKDSKLGQWEIMSVTPSKTVTVKVTSESDDLSEVINDVCGADASEKWVFHSEETLLKHRF